MEKVDFQALHRTRKWLWRVHHSHQKALVWVCIYLWWMDWLYRILRGGWRTSTENCCVVLVGHTSLFQCHPAPKAADTRFHKQGDGLCVQCWDLLVLWHCRSTKACMGNCTWWKMLKKMKKASEDLNNRTQEVRWEGIRLFGLERRCRIGTRSLQCQETATACCKGRNVKPCICRG